MSNLYAVSGLIAKRYDSPRPLVLIAQRATHKSYGGLWEFPGGKLESGETPQEAIKRELSEELSGIEVSVGEHIATASVSVEGISRDIALYWCLIPQNMFFSSLRPNPEALQQLAWVFPWDLWRWPLIPGAVRFSPHVVRYFAVSRGGQ